MKATSQRQSRPVPGLRLTIAEFCMLHLFASRPARSANAERQARWRAKRRSAAL